MGQAGPIGIPVGLAPYAVGSPGALADQTGGYDWIGRRADVCQGRDGAPDHACAAQVPAEV